MDVYPLRILPSLRCPTKKQWLGFAMPLLAMATAWAVPPEVSHVTAAQIPGSEKVEIRYDLVDPDSPVLNVSLQISSDGGMTWTVPVAPVTGALGARVPRGTGLVMVWDAGRAWDNQRSEQVRFRITASDVISTAAPTAFALIPAGQFSMGNQNPDADDQPSVIERSHRVTLDAFYMAKSELSKAEWDEVYAWAVTHGYEFTHRGEGKAPEHPVYAMSWQDAVKWCNAKTEKEGTGLQPCYTLGGEVFRKGGGKQGRNQPRSYMQCDFSKNGYRLPTEAEWEKAARGGQAAWRFPWGNTINFDKANYGTYLGDPGPGYKIYGYDEAPFTGFHPLHQGNTAPVAYFGAFANGYGLLQMSGNVQEWCWDVYDSQYYSTGPGLNPRGPDPLLFYPNPNGQGGHTNRVIRGGSHSTFSLRLRVAARGSEKEFDPGNEYRWFNIGFRLARSL